MNTYDSELHNKRKAIKYMRDNIEYHVDPLTSEVNITSLAEDAWGNMIDPDNPCPLCRGEVGHRIDCPHGIAFSSN